MINNLFQILNNLEFASPLYFWIGGALILLLIFFPWLKKRKEIKFDLGFYGRKIRLESKAKNSALLILVILTSLLVAATLADPQIVAEKTIPISGKPAMIIVDVSGSMTEPYEQNLSKLEKTREVYSRIVQKDLGVDFGLLIYSDQCYIARDFTSNPELLKDSLENDEEIKEISKGTKTALALDTARTFLIKNVRTESSMILFSDLIDDFGEVAEQIRKNQQADIQTYIIVVTKDLPTAEEKINEIKKRTGEAKLKMVWIGDQNGIDQIGQELKSMEIGPMAEEKILLKQSLIPQLLLLILTLLIISVFLSETLFRKV